MGLWPLINKPRVAHKLPDAAFSILSSALVGDLRPGPRTIEPREGVRYRKVHPAGADRPSARILARRRAKRLSSPPAERAIQLYAAAREQGFA